MHDAVPSLMNQCSFFKVEAKIGGYVVAMPDLSMEDAPTKEFVATSAKEIHDKLDKWLAWLERDESAIESIEKEMKVKR